MRMSDQKKPVSTCTEATRCRWMLISFIVNHERFLLTTAVSVTSRTVGKRRFPRVQRLAVNDSTGMAHPIAGRGRAVGSRLVTPDPAAAQGPGYVTPPPAPDSSALSRET